MANSREARVKLTNTELDKLKSEAKNKTGTTLRLNNKNSEDEELPHSNNKTNKEIKKCLLLITCQQI